MLATDLGTVARPVLMLSAGSDHPVMVLSAGAFNPLTPIAAARATYAQIICCPHYP